MEILKGEPGTYAVSWGSLKVGPSGLIYSYKQAQLDELKALGFHLPSEKKSTVKEDVPVVPVEEAVEVPVVLDEQPDATEPEAEEAEDAPAPSEKPTKRSRRNASA